MLERYGSARAILAVMAIAAAGCAYADGGHIDRFTREFVGCDYPKQAPGQSAIRADLEDAVFSVWVMRNEGSGAVWQRNGTASLIDDTGMFLTAGHVVRYDINRPIRIRKGADRSYNVEVLQFTYVDKGQDLALLKAMGWDKVSRYPFPLRFDGIERIDGSFIGFEESRDNPVHKHFGYYHAATNNSASYEGLVFGHSSGALLYDNFGRAFAAITKHEVPTLDTLTGQPTESVIRDIQKRTTVWGFPLLVDTLKEWVPAGEHMTRLIARLRNNPGARDLPANLSQETALDLIHLIDELYSGKLASALIKSNLDEGAAVLRKVFYAADELCVMSYWTKMLALQIPAAAKTPSATQVQELDQVQSGELKKSLELRGDPGLPSQRPAGAPGGGDEFKKRSESIQSQAAQALVDQLGVEDPEIAAKVGVAFLEQALAASQKNEDAASNFVRLALASMRRGAASQAIRLALQNNAEHRVYAALLGNLALAEDIGIKYGLGTKQAATEAIFAANALGGSPAAYELAANYALPTEFMSAASAAAQRQIIGGGAQQLAWRCAQWSGERVDAFAYCAGQNVILAQKEQAILDCAVSSRTTPVFATCAAPYVGIRLSEDQQIVVGCAMRSEGDVADFVSCAGSARVGGQLTPVQRALLACAEDANGDTTDFATCSAPRIIGARPSTEQRIAVQCAAESQGDSTIFATCTGANMFNLNLNAEQQIAVRCVVSAGGQPYAAAGCMATRLTERELTKCSVYGIGGSEGCFGGNNDLMGRNGWTARTIRQIAGGPNSVIGNPDQIWGGNSSFVRNPDQNWGGNNSFVRNASQFWGGNNSVFNNPGQLATQPLDLNMVGGGRRVCIPWC